MTNTATTRQLEIQNGVLKRYCYKHTLLVDTTLNQERTMKDLSAYQQEYADIKEQIQSASQDQPVKQWVGICAFVVISDSIVFL